MAALLEPLLPTPADRDQPDGTTAWSDEVGLPGPPRLLAWTVVQDRGAKFDLHVLWDTQDLTDAMTAAVAHAHAFFRTNMTGGVVIATLNSADNAVRRRFSSTGELVLPDAGASSEDTVDEHGAVGPVLLERDVVGDEHRDVDAWLHANGNITIEVCDWGPAAEQLTGGSEIEYFYEVPAPMVPRFMALGELDGSDLMGSLERKWSGRYDELLPILEHALGLERQPMP